MRPSHREELRVARWSRPSRPEAAPAKEITMKITIADVTIQTREVELPDKCPKCGEALRDVALTGYEYQDQSRAMSVREDGDVDYKDSDLLPESGESYIGWVSLSCECGHVLAQGTEERI